MPLAIFPGSLANLSCIAERELSKVLHEGEAPILAPFSTGLQCRLALLLSELSLLSFFCPDVSFLWPASVSLPGILTVTCYVANYCWKCSLDIKKTLRSLEKAATHWVRAGAMLSHARPQCGVGIGRSEIQQGSGTSSNFDQSINWHFHMKDHVEIGHLTPYDAFRVNRDQVMDLKNMVQNPYKRL